MKIRIGFVSNSSSVSFLITSKEELTKDFLEKRLAKYYRYYKDRPFINKVMNFLWESIDYEQLDECKPYEFEFYELTLGQGQFHYYPGTVPSDCFEDIHGLFINEQDFKLCVGYFERPMDWENARRQPLKLKGRIFYMYGVKLYLFNNDIKEIKEIRDLKKLKNLMVLDLSRNKIQNFLGLEDLTDLKLLKLNDNKIEEIKDLEILTNLDVLYLDNNQINKVDNFKSNKLRILDLSF